jgi:hypothetical protein
MKGNSEWTISTLKAHFDEIIADRDAAVQAALSASQTAMDKAEARLNEILDGFPQEYSRKSEIEALETAINAVKADHVQRREFGELKDAQSQGRGARTAFSAALGIIVALIAVALGAMYANQITTKDVSVQIDREAPWLSDRPVVDARLSKLEQQVVLLQTQVKTHEATDRLRAALSKKG